MGNSDAPTVWDLVAQYVDVLPHPLKLCRGGAETFLSQELQSLSGVSDTMLPEVCVSDTVLLATATPCLFLRKASAVERPIEDLLVAAVPLLVVLDRLTPPMALTEGGSRVTMNLEDVIGKAMEKLPVFDGDPALWFTQPANSILVLHTLPRPLTTILASLVPAFVAPHAVHPSTLHTRLAPKTARLQCGYAGTVVCVSVPTANVLLAMLGPMQHIAGTTVPGIKMPEIAPAVTQILRCVYASSNADVQRWHRSVLKTAEASLTQADSKRALGEIAQACETTHRLCQHAILGCSERAEDGTSLMRRFPAARVRVERAQAMYAVIAELVKLSDEHTTPLAFYEGMRPMMIEWLDVFSASYYPTQSAMVTDHTTKCKRQRNEETDTRVACRRHLRADCVIAPKRAPVFAAENAPVRYHALVHQQQVIMHALAKCLSFFSELRLHCGTENGLAAVDHSTLGLTLRWSTDSAIEACAAAAMQSVRDRKVVFDAWCRIMSVIRDIMNDNTLSTIFFYRSKTRGTFPFSQSVLHNAELRLLQCVGCVCGMLLTAIDFAMYRFFAGERELIGDVYVNIMAQNHLAAGILPMDDLLVVCNAKL